MRFIDRPFAVAVGLFIVGSLSGVAIVLYAPFFRVFMLELLQARMLSPVNFAYSSGGQFAVFLLVFANNSSLVFLSFLYPFLLGTVHWAPPLGEGRRFVLLLSFTLLTAFVVGFLGFGGTVSLEWLLNGRRGLLGLLSKSWLHAPVELGFILLCVSEPMRLGSCAKAKDVGKDLRKDLWLFTLSLIGLLVAAALEVYSMV